MNALKLALIYVNVTRNNYGMFIRFEVPVAHVLLAFNNSACKIVFVPSLLSQKYNFV